MLVTILIALNILVLGSAVITSVCDRNNVPRMLDFSPLDFEGVWFPMYEYQIRPSFYAGIKSLKYNNSYEGWKEPTVRGGIKRTVVSEVSIVFQDGSCADYFAEYTVDRGSLSTAAVLMTDRTVRRDVLTVLDTDYQSILLFVYEIFKNGIAEEGQTNLGLLVRDPSLPPNVTAIALTLEKFCGLDAASINFFTPHTFDWSATCTIPTTATSYTNTGTNSSTNATSYTNTTNDTSYFNAASSTNATSYTNTISSTNATSYTHTGTTSSTNATSSTTATSYLNATTATSYSNTAI